MWRRGTYIIYHLSMICVTSRRTLRTANLMGSWRRSLKDSRGVGRSTSPKSKFQRMSLQNYGLDPFLAAWTCFTGHGLDPCYPPSRPGPVFPLAAQAHFLHILQQCLLHRYIYILMSVTLGLLFVLTKLTTNISPSSHSFALI